MTSQGLDILYRVAKQEEVLVADGFADFDVGAVKRADRHGPVHHELHVARSRGLLARCRNLLGQVGRRTDLLHARYVVIGVEDHL